MPGIRALHLLNAFGDSSITRIVMRLIDNMRADGIEWHIGCLGSHGLVPAALHGLGVPLVDFSQHSTTSTFALSEQIRRYVRIEQIKIIHTHTPRTIFMAALSGKPNRKTVHLATKHLITRPGDRQWGILFTLLDRLSLYFPDWLVPVSQQMYRGIIRQFGIRADRVTRIYNAIPCEEFHLPEERAACRDELGIPADAVVLTYAGRIQRVKQIDVLLEAFRQISETCPNSRLVVVGDGDQKQRLMSYSSALGISERVIWTGYRADVPRLLAATDLYVQTSVNEGLSLSMLEALASGKPIVATDAGGNSEIIQNGVNGCLVPIGSAAEFADSVLWLIDHPRLRHQFASAGLERARNRFSLDSMVGAYRDLYRTVISEYQL